MEYEGKRRGEGRDGAEGRTDRRAEQGLGMKRCLTEDRKGSGKEQRAGKQTAGIRSLIH